MQKASPAHTAGIRYCRRGRAIVPKSERPNSGAPRVARAIGGLRADSDGLAEGLPSTDPLGEPEERTPQREFIRHGKSCRGFRGNLD